MDEDLRGIILRNLELLKLQIITGLVRSGHYASGNTARSLQSYADYFGGRLTGASYIRIIETGRRGGKIPYNFEDIIKRWAQSKGLPFAFNKKLISAIAWKIKREGTAQIYKQEEKFIEDAVNNFGERLSRDIGEKIQYEIIKSI